MKVLACTGCIVAPRDRCGAFVLGKYPEVVDKGSLHTWKWTWNVCTSVRYHSSQRDSGAECWVWYEPIVGMGFQQNYRCLQKSLQAKYGWTAL